MRVTFGKLDASGDGVLSVQEVANVMKASGSELSDQEIAELFMKDDIDGDKKITFDEFWASYSKRDPNTVKEEELRGVFKSFDLDGNGSLTTSDMSTQFKGRLNEDKLAVIISQADNDNNGQVSFEEFLKMWKDGL